MNNVNMIGRICKDLEVRFTQSNNTAMANFTLAVNRKFKKDGQQDADFINCQAWAKTAEIMAKYCTKGSQIGITGRINTRNYEGKDGKKVYVTEVIVEDFYFCGNKADTQQKGDAYEKAPSANKKENEMELPSWLETDELPF